MRPERRYFFDLSSSARWGGNAVGIIRVERELAKRARAQLGNQIQFCIYDKAGHRFLHVPEAAADDIVHGRAWYSFDPRPGQVLPAGLAPASSFAGRAASALPQELSYQLLLRPKAYKLLQKLRGRSCTDEDVARVRAEREQALLRGGAWAQARSAWRTRLLRHPRAYRAISGLLGRKFSQDDALRLREQDARSKRVTQGDVRFALDAFPEPVKLDDQCVVISGGLDWDHKDLRVIYGLKRLHKFKYMAIVYDLIPINYPHFVVPGYDTLLRDYIGELVWVADRGLCISQTTRRDLEAYAEANGVDGLDATVFPLGNDLPGAGPGDRERKAELLPVSIKDRRFGLFVSTIEPRKNHRVLYEAWDLCVRQGRVDPARHCLVFAGRRGWGSDDLVREISMNPATRDSIILLDHVSDALLEELYRQSAFSLFPSHYEGYGLPLAEALLSGKASFASNAGALAEIGADLVVRCDPKDIIGWAGNLSRAMTDEAYVESLEARTREDFAATTWDAAAQVFFEQVTAQVPA